jgi:hypothetical protein
MVTLGPERPALQPAGAPRFTFSRPTEEALRKRERKAAAREDLPVQHDVGYPSLCVPSISTNLLPRSIQYRQNGARTCTYLALLRRSDDTLKEAARGARKRRKNSRIHMRSRLESSILRPTRRRTPLPVPVATRALPRRVLRSPRRYGISLPDNSKFSRRRKRKN